MRECFWTDWGMMGLNGIGKYVNFLLKYPAEWGKLPVNTF